MTHTTTTPRPYVRPIVRELLRLRLQSRQWFRVWTHNGASAAMDLVLPDNRVFRLTDADAVNLPTNPLSPCLLRLLDLSLAPHDVIEVDALSFPSVFAAVRYAENWRSEYFRLIGAPPADYPQSNDVPSWACM